jgi:hypothetical protein
MKPIDVWRSSVRLDPDRTQVLARFFRLTSGHRLMPTTLAMIPLEQVLAAME